MKLLLIFALVMSGCTFKKKHNNQTASGHNELYSHPGLPTVKDPEKFIRLSVASFNDLEAQHSPLNIEFTDKSNKQPQTIKIGGAQVIEQYLSILRQNSPNTVLLDSGDIFSPEVRTDDIKQFYEKLGFDALTLGTSDFNIKLPDGYQSSPQFFKDFVAKSKTPLVLSNLYDLRTARHIEWPGVKPYLLKQVGELKVGVIGLIPDDIVGKTTVDNRLGLFVENMLQSTLRQARLLRSLGANIVVVITHQNIHCGYQVAKEKKLPLEKVNFEPHNENLCDLTGILGDYVKRLPPQLVDLVIGGRTEEKVANYVGNTIVMSGFPKGSSFSLVDFYFDKKSKQLIPELTQVYQPIMTCHEFFSATNDCYYRDPSINHSKRIPAIFFEKEIKPVDTNEKSSSTSIDWKKAKEELGVDLIFNLNNNGYAKILRLEISGKELAQLLEEEYNLGNAQYWHPNPFAVKNDLLALYISGERLDQDKNYLIALDLESRNDSILFSKRLKDASYEILPNKSFVDFSYSDQVSTRLSAKTKDTKPLDLDM